MEIPKRLEILIKTAIKRRHPIEFTYHGKPRAVDVYALGRSTADNILIRAYQTRGGHVGQHDNPCWHLFKVADMIGTNLDPTKVFELRSDYVPDDSALPIMYANVDDRSEW